MPVRQSLFALCLISFGLDARGICLTYDEPVELTGIMQIRVFFAQPNYGENPETDAREAQGVLFLDKPICTVERADSATPDEANQIEVTLVSLDGTHLRQYAGLHVAVTGILFHAITGHHHTPLLLSLSKPPRPLQ